MHFANVAGSWAGADVFHPAISLVPSSKNKHTIQAIQIVHLPPVRNVHRVDGVAVVSLTAYVDVYLIIILLPPKATLKEKGRLKVTAFPKPISIKFANVRHFDPETDAYDWTIYDLPEGSPPAPYPDTLKECLASKLHLQYRLVGMQNLH